MAPSPPRSIVTAGKEITVSFGDSLIQFILHLCRSALSVCFAGTLYTSLTQCSDCHSATQFQSGFVFGIGPLAAFLMSSVMSIVGSNFSYRTMAFIGTFTLGVEVVAFGMLQFTDDAVIFLTLSYLLRYENFYLSSFAELTSWADFAMLQLFSHLILAHVGL